MSSWKEKRNNKTAFLFFQLLELSKIWGAIVTSQCLLKSAAEESFGGSNGEKKKAHIIIIVNSLFPSILTWWKRSHQDRKWGEGCVENTLMNSNRDSHCRLISPPSNSSSAISSADRTRRRLSLQNRSCPSQLANTSSCRVLASYEEREGKLNKDGVHFKCQGLRVCISIKKNSCANNCPYLLSDVTEVSYIRSFNTSIGVCKYTKHICTHTHTHTHTYQNII